MLNEPLKLAPRTNITKYKILVVTETYNYRRDPNKSGGGTQLLHAPPTAHMVRSIFSFAVAVDTLGGYNWRHRGDFSISTFNPLKGPNLDQNLRNKIIQFSELLEWFGGVQGGN